MERKTRKKVSKEIEDLNSTISQLDLKGIYKTFYATTEYTFFSRAHGKFSKIDHMLDHKLNLTKFKNKHIIKWNFSDHNRIKLEMNNGGKTGLQSYSNQNSMVLPQKQTHSSIEQNREPRNKPTYLWSINLQQRRQGYTMGKRVSSISGAGKTAQLRVKE